MAPHDLPLLPNEPRVQDWHRQDELTRRFLAAALPELEALFLHVRAEIDPGLREAMPSAIGKPYPLGRCFEISEAVMGHLRTLDLKTLPPTPARGYRALQAFNDHGGEARQVWGDLRGQYFQNAFQIGTLYLDAANDTVVATKPKVEVLPFQDAQFTPVRDFVHFAHVAIRYWKAKIIPNHILPSIAPYFPILAAIPGGSITIPFCDYMLGLAQREAFASSENILGALSVEPSIFDMMGSRLEGSGLEMARTREKGREQAIARCKQFRVEGWHAEPAGLSKIIDVVLRANRLLEPLKVSSPAAQRP